MCPCNAESLSVVIYWRSGAMHRFVTVGPRVWGGGRSTLVHEVADEARSLSYVFF